MEMFQMNIYRLRKTDVTAYGTTIERVVKYLTNAGHKISSYAKAAHVGYYFIHTQEDLQGIEDTLLTYFATILTLGQMTARKAPVDIKCPRCSRTTSQNALCWWCGVSN